MRFPHKWDVQKIQSNDNKSSIVVHTDLEGVSGEAAGAPADGDVAPHVALGARAARRGARVHAVVVLAGLLRAEGEQQQSDINGSRIGDEATLL